MITTLRDSPWVYHPLYPAESLFCLKPLMVVKPLDIFLPIFALISTRIGPALLTCNKNYFLHHVYMSWKSCSAQLWSLFNFLIHTFTIDRCVAMGCRPLEEWRTVGGYKLRSREPTPSRAGSLVRAEASGLGKMIASDLCSHCPTHPSWHKDKYTQK